ncbi:uncharacterized protein LOC117103484 [Anneissia japonica]|uniref:uncharacterized protein LOC117103484 n=1 Tax=Anneissia japonica TaxID=1529436 RepID=UPI0014256DB6|nr:uncharacterized protein LOC117103484 [Anneissia japonica]
MGNQDSKRRSTAYEKREGDVQGRPRTLLAAMHYNEKCGRQQATTKNGGGSRFAIKYPIYDFVDTFGSTVVISFCTTDVCSHTQMRHHIFVAATNDRIKQRILLLTAPTLLNNCNL